MIRTTIAMALGAALTYSIMASNDAFGQEDSDSDSLQQRIWAGEIVINSDDGTITDMESGEVYYDVIDEGGDFGDTAPEWEWINPMPTGAPE